MARATVVLAFVALLASLVVRPAPAAAPAEGVVVEGESVPGVALGDTRAQAVAAWGQPGWCQDVELSGDQAFCSFPIDGGGNVYVRYRGSDGRYARNAADDVVYELSWGNSTWWSDQIIDWTTTAGINTSLALADREAVAAAYPDAEVSYDAAGSIVQVDDPQRGIRIGWAYDSYTHTTSVHFYVFEPQLTAPPGGDVMAVTGLDLSASKVKGERHILAVLRVQDEQGLPVAGAAVSVTWTYPGGATQTIDGTTTATGYDFFEINDARRGTWAFTVNDVVLDGYQLDRADSLLSASIKVK